MKTKAFVITDKCEENCAYCFQAPQKDITLEEFKELLKKEQTENDELTKIVITGGNPELNPNFWKICETVKSAGLKLKIHSNYFNKKTWEKYVKIADELSIPIDSLDKASLRGEENTKKMLAAFDYFLGKIQIQVHTVVGKNNAAELGKIKEFLEKKGFFEKNSWKIFRLIETSRTRGLKIANKKWAKITANYKGKNTHFVENVMDY